MGCQWCSWQFNLLDHSTSPRKEVLTPGLTLLTVGLHMSHCHVFLMCPSIKPKA